MNNRSEKTIGLVQMALFSAIIIVMASVPFLGYIPLGFMNATIIHIPVILGALTLGPKRGAILGGLFGLTSMLRATFEPNLTSFVFSPFYSMGEMHGNWTSLIVCFVPRILIGVIPYFLYRFIRKRWNSGEASSLAALGIAGVAGSMTNTLLVMNFIYFFFGESYASASNIAYQTLYGAILSVIVINGIPEAIIAAIIVIAIGRVLKKVRVLK